MALDFAESTERAATPQSVPRRIARLLGRNVALWLGLGVFGSIIGGAVELAISVFLQLFLGAIGLLPSNVQPTRWLRGVELSPTSLVVFLLTVALLRALGQFLVAQSAIRSLEQMNARLRRLAVYELLLRSTKRFIPAALVHARLSDVFPKASQFSFYLASLASGTAQSLIIASVMVATAWRESLIGFVGLGFVGLIVLRINRRIRRIAALIPKEQLLLTESVERVARNMLLIRTMRTQGLEHGRFVSSIDNYARHSMRSYLLNDIVVSLTPFGGLLLVTAIIAVSQRYANTPSLTLISFLYLFIRFVQGMATNVAYSSAANHHWPQFSAALAYSDGFDDDARAVAFQSLSAITSGTRLRHAPSEGGEAPPPIVVRDLTFRHAGRDEYVIRKLSVEVGAGALLAITGPSGVGKSTLLALLLGLLDPESGDVRIGGRLARDFFDDATTRVGYVGAEPFLIAGSLRDNIAYGFDGKVSDKEVWHALESASLAAAVRELPGTLSYPINEDGSGLSAGQKQRLCLARALLNKPHVLVLDEVSANLDDATERQIALTLQELRGRCTILVVSHRLGLIEFADQRLALEEVSASGARKESSDNAS